LFANGIFLIEKPPHKTEAEEAHSYDTAIAQKLVYSSTQIQTAKAATNWAAKLRAGRCADNTTI
jgi:hypothetical protein